MKKLSIFSLLSLILLIGCTKENPQLAEVGPDESLSLRGKHVPFKATVDLVTTGFGQKCTELEEVVNPIVEGTGKATHLGRTSLISDHCFFSSRAADPLKVKNGTATFKAANGDLLRLIYQGAARLNPPGNQIIFDLSFQFDGGTGRFKDAEGSGSIDWIVTFPSWPPPPAAIAQITANYDGVISY